VSTFSFYPSKNLGAFGDGGAIVTSDDAIADRVRSLRFHGSRDKVTYEEVGYNSRLDEIQAAILRVLLPQLDGWSEQRRSVARAYETAGLGDVVGLPVPVGSPAWHLFVVRSSDSVALERRLGAAGIGARAYYRTPVHQQEAMRAWGSVSLPGTDEAARTHLALPIFPTMSLDQVSEVVDAVAGE
jgi:dTDP-4-amino-4,6-dideoxygalactose transaminase